MAITIDEMMDVSSREERGRVVRLVRKLKLSGITAPGQQGAIAEVLASDQLPEAGSAVLVNDSVLFLTGRDPTMNQDNTIADVVLTYEGGTSSASGDGELRRGFDASIAQVRTLADREGNEILVKHAGVEQRAELSVFQPQAAPWIETVESTNDPDALADQWIGVTNSAVWRGKAKGKWIVARIRGRELNPRANPQLWLFRWSFQESSESQGWLPVVAYVDPRTNQPPTGLVDGEGIKAVPYYIERDYKTKFK